MRLRRGPVAHAWRSLLHRLPKVDLHRHLEGSLRLSTLMEIARRHQIQFGLDIGAAELEPLIRFTVSEPADFHRFLSRFQLLRLFYTSEEAIRRMAYEAVVDAALDHVRYLELRFNPAALAQSQGFRLEEVIEWVLEGVEQAQREFEIQTRLILTIVRGENPEIAWRIARLAIAYRPQGVVALDLAGDELRKSAKELIPVFQWAREQGLFLTIHAGEVGPPANIRHALLVMGAHRIGHGIQAIHDFYVLRLLHERNIPLEICPTSNLQTGAVGNFRYHPLPDLYRLGLKVTLNTDDPSISDTTLTDEYLFAMAGMGLHWKDLLRILENAVEAAFLSPEERQLLTRRLRQEIQAIERSWRLEGG
ncbi:adenosine deaminase [Thermoflexus sp.]|uniref:adenosine deaminase n=1 Tax=Thermoflexus sp. TaxID=1969742 RepID=UPI0026362885|nr:adenosine deaminase [Thermoflexus sp.]MCX7689507.1 adenosine deaminase [Thermoflexus sp.]